MALRTSLSFHADVGIIEMFFNLHAIHREPVEFERLKKGLILGGNIHLVKLFTHGSRSNQSWPFFCSLLANQCRIQRMHFNYSTDEPQSYYGCTHKTTLKTHWCRLVHFHTSRLIASAVAFLQAKWARANSLLLIITDEISMPPSESWAQVECMKMLLSLWEFISRQLKDPSACVTSVNWCTQGVKYSYFLRARHHANVNIFSRHGNINICHPAQTSEREERFHLSCANITSSAPWETGSQFDWRWINYELSIGPHPLSGRDRNGLFFTKKNRCARDTFSYSLDLPEWLFSLLIVLRMHVFSHRWNILNVRGALLAN